MLFFELSEACGAGPDTEIVVATPRLLGNDVHSNSSQISPVRISRTGEPAYSMERWLRLRFPPPMGQITDVRMWTPGINLPDGYEVHAGLSITYRTPTNARSDIATSILPTADPGSAITNLVGQVEIDDFGVQYSPWLVFQAILTGHPADQSEQNLTLEFGWTES